jgi:WD40 repeat protein
MTEESLGSAGPYKELDPFEEKDAPYFFGRTQDRDVIVANLLGSRLTLLYGASGVGKSSILRAGVSYSLRQLAQKRRERGAPMLAVVTFDAWRERDDPIRALLRAVHKSVGESLGDTQVEPVAETLGLSMALHAWTERLEGTLLVILDQFEEYFLYHPEEKEPEAFSMELARAMNEPGLRVNFLISIREDALARLDRFKGHIPALFDNYLRLQHLKREAARQAILGPLEEYRNRQGDGPADIEPELVEEVLDQVAADRIETKDSGKGLPTAALFLRDKRIATPDLQLVISPFGRVVAGRVEAKDSGKGQPRAARPLRDKRITTPYLQLVISRLWKREKELGSSVLRLKTLANMGGAEEIVHGHIDTKLAALSLAEQDIAAKAFRYLVTRQGSKIALATKELTEFSDQSEGDLQPVLNKLCDGRARILNSATDTSGTVRYEIFHDVLGPAILDWREQFVQAHKEAVRYIRDRWRFLVLGLKFVGLFTLLIGIVTFVVWAIRRSDLATEQTNVATAARLANQAYYYADRQPDLALLLSAQAANQKDSFESRSSLLMNVQKQPPPPLTLNGLTNPITEITRAEDNLLEVTDGFKFCSWSVSGYRETASHCRNRERSSEIEVGTRVPSENSVKVVHDRSPDRKIEASIDESGYLKVWRAVTGEPILGLPETLPRARSLAFRKDGRLAVGCEDGTVRLLTLPSLLPFGDVRAKVAGSPESLALSSDHNLLAYVEKDGILHLWSIADKKDLCSGRGKDNGTLNVAFSPKGILATGSTKGTVQFWSLKDCTETSRLLISRDERMRSLVFSPDGRFLATVGEEIRLWEVPGGREIGAPIDIPDDGVVAMVLRSTGELLIALMSSTGKVDLWMAEVATSGELRHIGEIPPAALPGASSLAFSAEGDILAVTGDRIYLWSVDRHQLLGELPQGAKAVAFAPTGTRLIALNQGNLREWDLRTEAWRDEVCRIVFRNLSLEEWRRFLGPDRDYECTCLNWPPGEGVKGSCQKPEIPLK